VFQFFADLKDTNMSKSEVEKQLAGEVYHSGDAEFITIINRARDLTLKYNSLKANESEARNKILAKLLGKIGTNAYIDTPFYCDFGVRTEIGDNVYIGMNCTFIDNHSITIGNNTLIASGVQICTATHPIKASERIVANWSPEMNRNCYHTYAKPVRIGDNCWIGANATILPGVTIGNNTTIGAGSVVTKDIPSRVLAIGVPCKVIRQLDN
jgi:maltose O-acetyltransferase